MNAYEFVTIKDHVLLTENDSFSYLLPLNKKKRETFYYKLEGQKGKKKSS